MLIDGADFFPNFGLKTPHEKVLMCHGLLGIILSRVQVDTGSIHELLDRLYRLLYRRLNR